MRVIGNIGEDYAAKVLKKSKYKKFLHSIIFFYLKVQISAKLSRMLSKTEKNHPDFHKNPL